MTDYTHHARVLDRDHHHHDFRTTGTWGPVERRLQSFTTVRGLVFGQFGEASADVHDLLRAAARLRGDRREWRLAARAFQLSFLAGTSGAHAMCRCHGPRAYLPHMYIFGDLARSCVRNGRL